MIQFKPLTESEVTFSYECENEDMSFVGNCMASGDPAVDKESEDWIRAELERGNYAAWCCLHVRAHWAEYTGNAYLGACSYDSEEALIRSAKDDYPDLKDEALADLNSLLADEFSDTLTSLLARVTDS